MADVQPLNALHYALDRVGGLPPVVAPPYDVIDAELRADLASRSPYNVVEIDLPQADGDLDPYAHAATLFNLWQADEILVRDPEPAFWALAQDYTGPDGTAYTRKGLFARVRVEDYGPGRIRPHERTHPGPKEDRLRLTRATRANLSPIFSLYDDPEGAAWGALSPHTETVPWGEVTDDDGTQHRLWRVQDAGALEAVTATLADTELLIADGHHRYETARVYADEIGGEGEHRYVLMCLVALQDPGLTVFPTHRLLTALPDDKRQALREAHHPRLGDDRGRRRRPRADGGRRRPHPHRLPRRPPPPPADAHAQGPRDRRGGAAGDARALPPPRHRRARGADPQGRAGHDRGRHLAPARASTTRATSTRRASASSTGDAEAAFFMSPTPVEHVRDVAAAGVNMPPKSTYFFPKVLTGKLFNPLA